MTFSRGWFLAGLFCTTLATLAIEILFTRMLSATMWYHLSFFAVSTALFGMSAGALYVYLGGRAFEGAETMRGMRRIALLFALVIPFAHVAMLLMPIPTTKEIRTITLAALAVMTVLVAVPFCLSGILVTIALTRVPGKIGVTYAVDLLGAALGTLAVVPLLSESNITSAFLSCGAIAAFGAMCFGLAARGGRSSAVKTALVPLAVAAALVGGARANQGAEDPLRVWFPKGSLVPFNQDTDEYWNIHSQVTVVREVKDELMFWGPGEGADDFQGETIGMAIDGLAGTVMTRWDGDRESLRWTAYDVTSLPYHLRKGGKAAVIGVGGGRDVLTALYAGSTSVTGIEINAVFIDLLEGRLREFAALADRPEVRLVHDEARSYLTRTDERYDVLQMSLIDTWASTGAGAMTLSENGLYTLEAWRVFLDTLEPTGLFSVSRWYAPGRVSETSRLVSLAVAALLERGVERPRDHMAMLSRGKVATLVLSPSPLAQADIETLGSVSRELGFRIVLAPAREPADEQLAAIRDATSREELDVAAANPLYDFSPPTDERPFFFNILKLGRAFGGEAEITEGPGTGVIPGNLRATKTLFVLFAVSLALVATVILAPLVASGLPAMGLGSFALALAYFASIGLGYMLVQIPLMQRFSAYLGHPTYALVVVLFSMILATGIGSWWSDRLRIEDDVRLARRFPLVIAAAIAAATLALQPLIDATIGFGLPFRILCVLLLLSPVAFLLGLGFPLGLRLVTRISGDAMPWMWGVNGAASVLAAVLSVAVSMSLGIHTNLIVALTLYASLALVAPALWRRGRA